MSEHENEPVEDGEWIEWRGGACPVSAECIVMVRRRYSSPITTQAGLIRWSHDLYNHYGADDVVGWKLVDRAI